MNKKWDSNINLINIPNESYLPAETLWVGSNKFVFWSKDTIDGESFCTLFLLRRINSDLSDDVGFNERDSTPIMPISQQSSTYKNDNFILIVDWTILRNDWM